MELSAKEDSDQDSQARLFDLWLERGSKVAPILGIPFIYALAYLVESGFYGPFGLSADQVGLSGTLGVLRLTPMALMILFVFAGSLGMSVVLAVSLLLAHRISGGRKVQLPVVLLIVVVGLMLLVAVDPARMGLPSIVREAAYSALGISAVEVAVYWFTRKHKAIFRAWNMVLAVGVLCVLGIHLNGSAEKAGQQLKSGSLPTGMSSVYLMGMPPVFGSITWRSGRDAPLELSSGRDSLKPWVAPRAMLILGSSGGRTSLYDYATHLVYQPSTADIIVTIIPNPCEGSDPRTLAPTSMCQGG